jgi:preprotein translocase subunit YajC
MSCLVLLAQQDAPRGMPGFLFSGWVPLVIIGVLFYFMLLRPERHRRAEMGKMLEHLKKNDRIVTVGGIFGTVVNVDKGTDQITIKVDEATNAKLRILRSAVSRVIVADEGATESKAPA